jgi:ABC-type transport system involved in multi-copper enzyme maturation permease subunit
MAFLALLTKELRSRLRRERTIWLIIVYILLMSVLGWFVIAYSSSFDPYNNDTMSNAGITFYYVLSMVQLFLILFMTPAFTATAVNGEKERQTFELLLCSQLSSFSLVAGKLIAGLANALLLVVSAIPLFSFIFFFGGVSPSQFLTTLFVYTATALLTGTFGLFCSTIFRRPVISTVITYLLGALWVILPVVGLYFGIILFYSRNAPTDTTLWWFIWHPVLALVSTYQVGSTSLIYTIGGLTVPPWVTYSILSIVASVFFFTLSLWTAKPNTGTRLEARLRSRKVSRKEKEKELDQPTPITI